MENLVLIDGNSLINRAFYAVPILTSKDGQFTNAVYGFTNMFLHIVNEFNPKYVAVAFDLKAPTFRHKLYDGYKGTRKPMPEELRPQIPLLKEILRSMNVAIFELEGMEADDIIGTIAKNTDVKTLIFTGDRDAFQLVDEQTEVHFTRRGITETEIYNLDNFLEKTTITPAQIIELKALMGDSSDNIPGVPNVGEKKALALLHDYASLDGVYEHIDELKGKLKENLENGKELAYLSKTLATINTDCGVDFDLEKIKFSMPLPTAAKDLFVKLGFKTLSSKSDIFEQADGSSSDKEEPIKPATEKDFSDFNLADFEKAGIADFITLTKPEKIITPEALSEISLSFGENVLAVTDKTLCLKTGEIEYLIPVREGLLDVGFSLSEALFAVKDVFDKSERLITFKKKELRHLLANLSIDITCPCEDVSILKYLADYTGKDESVLDVITGYELDQSAPATALYNAYSFLKAKLAAENMEKLYYDVELPLSDVLYDMETAGFKIDYAALTTLGEQYKKRITELETQIKEYAGNPNLNVNSPHQLGDLLFNQLRLGKGKKNRKGFSTSAEILEGLEDAHPVVPCIIAYRKVWKIYSTYIEGFKPLIDKNSGLIKTSFNQTVTSTGRLSSKEPNLQNIPVRESDGRELRKFFVPRDSEHILIGADYSQIELRLLAAFSNTDSLIKDFKDGKDIHAATAAKVFKVSPDKVDSSMRRAAKAVNFGIIYGISEYGLAKNLKVSNATAKEYIVNYFKEYPEVKAYMDENVAFAKRTGYALTLLGRKRYIKELRSPSYNVRSFGERAAMNMPLQGSSADIIKLAMLGVSRRLKKEGLKSKLILQVHDELIIDALKTEQEAVKKLLVEEMENAVDLKVKLTVELGMGERWYDTK